MNRLYSLIFVVLFAALPSVGSAGSSEAGKSILPSEEVATFANRVQNDLATRGANVAIVSRMGRDPRMLPPSPDYS